MAMRSSASAASGAVQVSALMSRLIVGVGDPLVLENDRELVHQEADPDRALGGVLTGLGRHTADVFAELVPPECR